MVSHHAERMPLGIFDFGNCMYVHNDDDIHCDMRQYVKWGAGCEYSRKKYNTTMLGSAAVRKIKNGTNKIMTR